MEMNNCSELSGKWYREQSFNLEGCGRKERWVFQARNNVRKEYEIILTLGKKTDLLSLKKNVLTDLKKQVEYFSKTRRQLYRPDKTENVEKCPVCKNSSTDSDEKVNIYGAKYNQCRKCTHVYVVNRPFKKTISDFYLSNVNYASTYTDKSLIEFRVESIAIPWVKWMEKTYRDLYGSKPKNILDIGSGAGHFVYACRKLGIHAEGVELSEHSRKFAHDYFNVDLHGNDFIENASKFKDIDVVTFWGLLEHTPNPSQIMQAAYSLFKEKETGMIVAKLPRWFSASSAIQRILPETIIRHLDPMGHIMCFTEASASTLFLNNGFRPAAAWYYGMDMYEVLMQLGLKHDNIDILTNSGDLSIKMQDFIDRACFCDSVTIAGVFDKKG